MANFTYILDGNSELGAQVWSDPFFCLGIVVVVYHVTIVAKGHGLLKKFWTLVMGCVLRTAGSSII